MKPTDPLRTGVTVAEFLALEDADDEMHILWDGEVYSVVAMAGGNLDHATLSANAIIEIGVALRGQRLPTGRRRSCV